MKIRMLVLFLSCAAFHLHGQDVSKAREHLNVEDNLAIQGYDPVAYFEIGEAKKGKKDIIAVHSGITYRFANSQHMTLFLQNPEKYLPKYGGWCAYAMGADGSKVRIDPKTFKIIEGELYLFYNFYFNNTLKAWDKDESKLHTSAEANWNRLIGNN